MPAFHEDLDMTPLQKVSSCLEHSALGSVYLTRLSRTSAPPPSPAVTSLVPEAGFLSKLEAPTLPVDQHELSMFETMSESEAASLDLQSPDREFEEQTTREWELWVSAQAIRGASEAVTNEEMDSIYFDIRARRAAEWNRVLSDAAQLADLTPTQLIAPLSPEVSLEDTLTLSGEQNILGDLQRSLEQEMSLSIDPESRGDQGDSTSRAGSSSLFSYVVRTAPISGAPLVITQLTPFDAHRTERSREFGEGSSQTESTQPVKTISLSHLAPTLTSLQPLFQLIERLHKRGLCLGGFDPALFRLVRAEGVNADQASCEVRPAYPVKLYHLPGGSDQVEEPRGQTEYTTLEVADLPFVRGEEAAVYLGYSPPEMYGYYASVPSARSDVFSAGMALYYAFTGCPRFAETMRPFARLPSPNVYRQDLPPELVSVIYKAISPNPLRRQADMMELQRELDWALQSAELREQISPVPLSLEAGHEIHIGLLKGQYNPINQDDLFLGYQSDSDIGLFVVTDGVSICEHGSGDLASGLVREEAAQCWRTICRSTQLGDEEETLSELNLNALDGQASNYGKTLKSLINGANHRIGEYINKRIPVFHGPPEGIMAATIVAAAVTRGVAVLTSVGDSRIYLIRDGHISSLMYDEDLYTHLLQAQQTPSQAQQSPSAAALVHCVGEFSKDADQRLVATPISPQLRELKILPGDQLVLCSDGIPDYAGVDEEDAEDNILRCVESALTVHHAAFELITLANKGGGGDNLSCIVLKFGESLEAMRGE